MKLTAVFLLTLSLIGTGMARGEAPTAKQNNPAAAVQALVDRFDREFTHVAEQMPADKYDFTPASLAIPGASFTKVRSFADQVKHVTQANYLIAANVAGRTEPTESVDAVGRLKSKDEILKALAASFASVHDAIATLTPSNANDVVDDSGVGPNQTRESEAAWVAVHGYDHYGQLVEYLRLSGIVPKP